MTAFLLSLVLGFTGAYGLYLTGKNKQLGPILGIAVQPVWLVYGLVTGGYGLIVLCPAYGWANYKNLQRMRNPNPVDAELSHQLKRVHDLAQTYLEKEEGEPSADTF